MKQRIIAAAVLWTLVLALPALFGKWGAFLLIAVFGAGTVHELLVLLKLAGRPVDREVTLAGCLGLLVAAMLVPTTVLPPLALLMVGLSAVLTACLLRANTGAFTATALPTSGAVALVFMPFAALILMIHESGLLLPIWVIAVTKFGDVGALLTGMWIGRHKLAPALSPKKTWEGLGGGVVLSVIVSVLFVHFLQDWLPAGLSVLHAAWTAVIISLAGVFGDLIESAFKREAKVKDSGTLIPGIGGFFDLSDSLLLAFPVAYFLTWIII